MIPLNAKLGRDMQLQIIMQYIYYTDIIVRHNLVIEQQHYTDMIDVSNFK